MTELFTNPLSIWDRFFLSRPTALLPHRCHCEECRQARRGNPLANLEMSRTQSCTWAFCAARLWGLLRRFEDSLLAMPKGGMGSQC